jgi:hypothetical protein
MSSRGLFVLAVLLVAGGLVWGDRGVAAEKGLGHAAEAKDAARPAVAWQTQYEHAMDVANREKKMLLIVFFDDADPLSKRLETETLADRGVREAMQKFTCLRLPADAKVKIDGKDSVLLHEEAFAEMSGRPGIAVADFAHAEPELHGHVVSTFPLLPCFFYGPEEMKVILDLPCGTLTQRTLIYAVRVHPERPASAVGDPDPRLLVEAESHSACQARIRLQGHHNWGTRFQRISGMLGCTAREVCAESWPGQGLLESAVECVRCWRLSSGHWSAVSAENRAFGYDMKLGCNQVWYATGIFGMR